MGVESLHGGSANLACCIKPVFVLSWCSVQGSGAATNSLALQQRSVENRYMPLLIGRAPGTDINFTTLFSVVAVSHRPMSAAIIMITSANAQDSRARALLLLRASISP